MGEDVALTEIVHCKSKHEIGVKEAYHECVSRHLEAILNLSSATILLALGNFAQRAVKEYLNPIQIDECLSTVKTGEREQLVLALPHPSSWAYRRLEDSLSAEQLLTVRGRLAGR